MFAFARTQQLLLLLIIVVVFLAMAECFCEGLSFSARSFTSQRSHRRLFHTTGIPMKIATTTTLFATSADSNQNSTNTVAVVSTEATASDSVDNSIRIEKPGISSPPNDDFKSQKPQTTATPRAKQNWSKNQEDLSKRRFPRTWVPLASVYELDPDRPTPVVFLEQKFVCYQQDAYDDESWVVMDDVCPHRLAPLSEGRIARCLEDDGTTSTTIQCSYHGWEFDREGSCVAIPQALLKVKEAALQNSQSGVASYSTRVHKNIVWFWPWPDTDPLSLMAVYPKGHPEGIMSAIANVDPVNSDDDDEMDSFPATYTRDLPYGWDTLLENLLDPAHIPFAHHGLQGKREDAIPITMTIPESLGGFQEDDENENGNESKTKNRGVFGSVGIGEAGFFFEWQDRTMGKYRIGTGEFQAPYGIAYDGVFYPTKEAADASKGSHKARKKSALERMVHEASARISTSGNDDNDTATDLGEFKLGALCIPTTPGWSRAIIFSRQDRRTSKSKSKTMNESKKNLKSTSDKAKATQPKKKKSVLGIIFALVPKWLIHLASNRGLDSDLAFLHHQEQERLRYHGVTHGNGSHSKNHYFMPTESDRCIAFLRRWIPKFTDYFDDAHYHLPAPISDQSKLFDRYSQHTSHCKHCQEGLAYLTQTVRKRAWAGLVFSIVVSHFTAGRRTMGFLAKIFGLVCFGVLGLIRSIEPAFKVGGFKHYENH